MKNFKNILHSIDNKILTITINRPEKLNALSVEVFKELEELIFVLKDDFKFSVKGVILTGAGERAFIAGADISQMSQMSVEQGDEFAAHAQSVTVLIESLPVPVIACVGGFALGGGCELAMCCDFIYATENARFGQPEVNLGLIPGFGGCVRLIRAVGPGIAKELIYTGRHIDAREAKDIGLINKVFVSKEEMLSGASETLRLCSEKSAMAISLCKETIIHTFGKTTLEALEIERSSFRTSFKSEDKVLGTKAFLAKESPQFVGR